VRLNSFGAKIAFFMVDGGGTIFAAMRVSYLLKQKLPKDCL
jgi:hypothetical protein